MNKEDKAAKLQSILADQLEVMNKIMKLSKKKSPKKINKIIKRCNKIIMLTMRMRGLEVQKHLIIATPTLKEGVDLKSGGPAIVSQSKGPEIITPNIKTKTDA